MDGSNNPEKKGFLAKMKDKKDAYLDRLSQTKDEMSYRGQKAYLDIQIARYRKMAWIWGAVSLGLSIFSYRVYKKWLKLPQGMVYGLTFMTTGIAFTSTSWKQIEWLSFYKAKSDELDYWRESRAATK